MTTTVGLCIPQLGDLVDRATVKQFAVRAEELGFASLWVQEHLFYPLDSRSGYAGIPRQPVPLQYQSVLAATETLTAVACWTEHIAIGTSVLVAGYHQPVSLAQRLATVDVLSGGRLVAGFSVGWSDEEHEQMGVDPRTRGRRCTELVQALIRCWDADPVQFSGDFFQIPPSIVRPKPLQRPRPRLLSGMHSEEGIARTARLFDIWNPSRGTAAEVAATAQRINALRDPTQAPIEVYHRVFLEPSVPDPSKPPPGIAGAAEFVEQARAAGLASVLIDANFWREIRSSNDWLELPERLATAMAIT